MQLLAISPTTQFSDAVLLEQGAEIGVGETAPRNAFSRSRRQPADRLE
jgi:hypothetical protein